MQFNFEKTVYSFHAEDFMQRNDDLVYSLKRNINGFYVVMTSSKNNPEGMLELVGRVLARFNHTYGLVSFSVDQS